MIHNLRILSLLPAATEIVYLLGLEKNLVGVTDDCDFPLQVKKIPTVTNCLVSDEMSSLEIDQQVKKRGHIGQSIAHLDSQRLKELNPNLILTQDLCLVCAVSYSQVQKAARILDSDSKIISLEPTLIDDVLENISLIGDVTSKSRQASIAVRILRNRLESVNLKLNPRVTRPKVLIIEWLDPLMVAGHWVPDMVSQAGGEMLFTKGGDTSYVITLDQVYKADPDIIIFAPCGFDIKRTLKERIIIDDLRLKMGKNKAYFLVDGNAYLTRPGPRLIDGVEILSQILYPEIFPKTYPKKAWQEIF